MGIAAKCQICGGSEQTCWCDDLMRNCPECGQAWPEQVYVFKDGKCARCNMTMLTYQGNPLLKSDG